MKLNNAQVREFESKLQGQYDQLKSHRINFKNLNTLYLGGGTPSLWGIEGVNFLRKFFDHNKIDIKNCAEVTLEVDPDAWNEDEIDEWLKLGVNRFSVGSQAFSKESLNILDRSHSIGQLERTLKYFNDRDLNYSVDVLIGAPIPDRNLEKELDQFLSYKPKHFSVYILQTRANYPLKESMPTDDIIEQEYHLVSKALSSKGYEQYEISNFALNGYKSQHNSSYWSLKNILALGPNATGFFVKNNRAHRYQVRANSNLLHFEYLDDKSLALEEVYLGLRTEEGIDPRKYFSDVEWEKLSNSLQKWKNEGRISSISESKLILSPSGYLMLDSLMNEFFKFTDL